MKKFFITFRSITYAQRCERIFSQDGMPCQIRRTPRWMENRGCGYGVEVRLSSVKQGIEWLQREHLPFRRIYLIGEDGTAEAVDYALS